MRVVSSRRSLQRDCAILTLCLTVLIATATSSKTATMGSFLFARLHTLAFHASMLALGGKPAAIATQITVFRSSGHLITAAPGAKISIQANFGARWALPQNDLLVLFLVDANGRETARVENDLNNRLTLLPTSRWAGAITVLSSMTIPQLPNGLYSIMMSIDGPTGPIQLTPGPDVTQDALLRYSIGAVRINSSAPHSDIFPTPTLDLKGFHLTFDEPFADISISDSSTNDGSRWYARNEECCMSTTDGTGTAMVGISSPRNPFSRIAGGGLNIRLQRIASSWTSGVITSVDSTGEGFSQQYGYFEMKAKFPPGENTWPAFWLLNTAARSRHAPTGEIDIVEYIANPGFPNYIATTLHDWSDNTAPAASHHQVPLPTSDFHTYGMMWTADTMTFYFDGAITLRTPTPSIMRQPYYLLVDLGIDSGYPTEKTPSSNDMQIQYIRAYSRG